jgi:hypothetical protein
MRHHKLGSCASAITFPRPLLLTTNEIDADPMRNEQSSHLSGRRIPDNPSEMESRFEATITPQK